jgi:predicted lactoylglutathione lyase
MSRVMKIRISYAFMTTVAEREKLYTKRQVRDAQAVTTVIKRLGYPSTKELREMVATGRIDNLPVSAQDIQRNEFIYGERQISPCHDAHNFN